MSVRLKDEVIRKVFVLLDAHLAELEAIQKRGIESANSLAVLIFEEAIEKRISEAHNIRHEFLTEVNTMNAYLKGLK